MDNNGYVYFITSYYSSSYVYTLYKYSIDGSGKATQLNYVTLENLGTSSTPFDILTKEDYIYVSYSNYSYSVSQDGGIAAYSYDLKKQGDLLSTATSNMYGPYRFVAILNSKIYFIDGCPHYSTDTIEQLGSIDDITDTTVETYGTYGNAEGQFDAFAIC